MTTGESLAEVALWEHLSNPEYGEIGGADVRRKSTSRQKGGRCFEIICLLQPRIRGDRGGRCSEGIYIKTKRGKVFRDFLGGETFCGKYLL